MTCMKSAADDEALIPRAHDTRSLALLGHCVMVPRLSKPRRPPSGLTQIISPHVTSNMS